MKKYIIVLMLVALITGCSKGNNLKCTSKEEVSGNTYENEVKLTYKDDKVKKAKLTIDVELGEASLKNYELYYNAFEQTFSDLDKEDGISINFKKNEKGYNVVVDVDYETYKGTVDMINSSLTKDQAKIYYENIKYECK